MTTTKRILVDCDGVLSDFSNLYLDVLGSEFGVYRSANDVTSWLFSECVATPEQDRGVWDYLASSKAKGLVLGMAEMEGAFQALLRLRTLGEVVCVTSPVWGGSWAAERFEWLRQKMFFDSKHVVFASRKALVGGDVLIDDAVHNLDEWRAEHHRGYSLLVSRPYNRADKTHVRVFGLQGAEAYLRDRRAEGRF